MLPKQALSYDKNATAEHNFRPSSTMSIQYYAVKIQAELMRVAMFYINNSYVKELQKMSSTSTSSKTQPSSSSSSSSSMSLPEEYEAPDISRASFDDVSSLLTHTVCLGVLIRSIHPDRCGMTLLFYP